MGLKIGSARAAGRAGPGSGKKEQRGIIELRLLVLSGSLSGVAGAVVRCVAASARCS